MPIKKIIFIILASQLLSLNAACAEEAGLISIMPDSISDIYSDVDMRVRLAAKPNAAPCVAVGCESQQEFDARVQQLGAQLSATAYGVYPTLKKRVPQFAFSVIDKKEPGTASNGAGKVVLFRGLQQLNLSDDALSFVLAREMGHVIGDHHASNTYTKLIISALATVAFPALAVLGVTSAAAQATTASTLLTSAASAATSMLGSEVALARVKPTQLLEADEIALNLMHHQGWDMHSAASVLQFDEPDSTSPQNGWMQDLQLSVIKLQIIVESDELAILPLEAANLLADAAPMEEEQPVKIGFEDVDPSKELNDAAQNLLVTEIVAAPKTEPATDSSADVIVEAIHTQ